MNKTIDLFGRVKSTDQAEIIATVLYAYDQIAKRKTPVFDKDVYDYIDSFFSEYSKKNICYSMIMLA